MLFLLLISLTIHFYLFKSSEAGDRIFLGVLFASQTYYCLGGYLYWVVSEQGYFAGVNWSIDDLSVSILALSSASTAIATIVYFWPRLFPAKTAPIPHETRKTLEIPYTALVLFFLGFIASVTVLSESLSAASFDTSGFDFGRRSDFFLIAYQFSDLLIPVILFLLVARGLTKFNLALIIYFLIYASFVGFRYKIALFIFPLGALLLATNLPKKRKIFYTFLFGLGVLAHFSILTLFRQKFSGIDLGANVERSLESFTYGLFAEANVVFGLTAIFSEYTNADQFVYLQPIYDAFLELIPRIILPDRVTGEYLTRYVGGFITDEGEASGTAYPFIGEFAVMGGWIGVCIGVIAYAMLYISLRAWLRKSALTRSNYLCGLGIVGGVMGYYHFSRGYLPQMLKAYLFVVMPFIFLCARQKAIELRFQIRNSLSQVSKFSTSNSR